MKSTIFTKFFEAKLKLLATADNKCCNLSFVAEGLNDADLERLLAIFINNPDKAKLITHINLSSNKLCNLPHNLAQTFPNLTSLNLSWNRIMIGPNLAHCDKLTAFDISYNPLQLPPQGLETLSAFDVTKPDTFTKFILAFPDNPVGVIAMQQIFAMQINNKQTTSPPVAAHNIIFTHRNSRISEYLIYQHDSRIAAGEFECDFETKLIYAERTFNLHLNTNKEMYLTAYKQIKQRALAVKQISDKAPNIPNEIIKKIFEYAFEIPNTTTQIIKHHQILQSFFGTQLPAFTLFQNKTYPTLKATAKNIDDNKLLDFILKYN